MFEALITGGSLVAALSLGLGIGRYQRSKVNSNGHKPSYITTEICNRNHESLSQLMDTKLEVVKVQLTNLSTEQLRMRDSLHDFRDSLGPALSKIAERMKPQ